MKLTPHEQKILKIIKTNPKVVNQPSIREKIANKHALTEKTLRNRIAELRKRGLLEKESKKLFRNKNVFYVSSISGSGLEKITQSIGSRLANEKN